jgi:hypothetical protein
MNAMGRGIYFMVNEGDGGGRSTGNVTRIRAIFVDLDGAPIEPIYNCSLEPHVILQSGPSSYHAYWLVDDCPLEEFKSLQLRVATRFNGDMGIHDLPRVMRIPGFYNCKKKYPEPYRVRVLQWNEILPYKTSTIIESLQLDDVEVVERASKGKISIHLDEIPPEGITEGHRHNWLRDQAYNMALDCKKPQEILARVMGLNQLYCKPPKEPNEIKQLVQSAVDNVPYVDTSDITGSRQVIPELLASANEVFEQNDDHDDDDTSLALPESLILSAPGIVGEITAWIAESNFYWQPAYALAASLSFVGMLKGHNVRTEENARTNLLTIAVGPSSSGKSQPPKHLYSLLQAAGLAHRNMGEPASEAALLRGLASSGHKAFLAWDEIGISFQQLFSPRAAQYKAGIVRTILSLFSYADSVYVGNQYANKDGKTPRVDLIQPCLCLYGTSTIEGIYSALSSNEAINGFAARLLVFETNNYLADSQPVGNVQVPSDLVERIKVIANDPLAIPEAGEPNIGRRFETPNPRIVPYSPQARKVLATAKASFEDNKNKAILAKKSAEESIWGRAYEHTVKVALTVEDGPAITEKSANWAVEVVTTLCKKMIVACKDRIADNQTHAELNQILRIIKDAYPKWIATKMIFRKTRSILRIKRKEYLLSLQEEGTIEVKEEETGGRKRQLYRYVK